MADSNVNSPRRASWDAAGRTPQETADASGYGPEQLTAVQLALVSMGYTLVPQTPHDRQAADGVDGQWSEGTQAAVLQFQQDTELEPTGQLDEETEEAILQAFGDALVTRGAGPLLADQANVPQPGEGLDAVYGGMQLDASDAIEGLAPQELPDEPVADLLDDVIGGTMP